MVISAVRFIDMGLKAFVFTKADQQQEYYDRQLPLPEKLGGVVCLNDLEKTEAVSEQEKAMIDEWLADYQKWQEEGASINSVTIQRQRDASNSLAMILVGLPLFLYHWRIIRRETKNK